jgi:hypothetical protein
MVRERTRAVCEGLRAALASYGVPEQILTDNGKVFTGRFNPLIGSAGKTESTTCSPSRAARPPPARLSVSTAVCVRNSSATGQLSPT